MSEESSRLQETFVRLCEIRSPTGEEREVADSVGAELRALGLEVSEDAAAGPAAAGAVTPSSLALAEAGLRRAGLEPARMPTGGGSDANALIAAGFERVLLANRTEANHTPEESVSARNLDAMLEVCASVVAPPVAAVVDGE